MLPAIGDGVPDAAEASAEGRDEDGPATAKVVVERVSAGQSVNSADSNVLDVRQQQCQDVRQPASQQRRAEIRR